MMTERLAFFHFYVHHYAVITQGDHRGHGHKRTMGYFVAACSDSGSRRIVAPVADNIIGSDSDSGSRRIVVSVADNIIGSDSDMVERGSKR
jgi:hypothetical protein